MVFSLIPEDRLMSPGSMKILDPAVGTGGFLISAIRNIENRYQERGFKPDQVRNKIQNVANSNLHGIDFNPFLVKVAQMNNVMHGDGSANVVHADSLQKPENWNSHTQDTIQLGTFDVVITNPPFGTKAVVDDPEMLSQYELATYGSGSSRESLPPEQLFTERCLDFLKPGGILGLVLLDSILSNPGLEWLRDWLLEEVNILASVDLPVEAFQPHTGTQTSVLILQKKKPTDTDDEYSIFMAMPETVGHDRRGNPIHEKTPDGEIKVNSDGVEIVDDDLPLVLEAFEKWVVEKGIAP